MNEQLPKASRDNNKTVSGKTTYFKKHMGKSVAEEALTKDQTFPFCWSMNNF